MADDTITVFWRPGCGFCAGLLRGLERHDLSFDRVNIWEDEEAAAFVRSVADGNETVPTVRVGEVALVNPTATQVMEVVAEEAPQEVPADYDPPQLNRVQRALHRLLGG